MLRMFEAHMLKVVNQVQKPIKVSFQKNLIEMCGVQFPILCI